MSMMDQSTPRLPDTRLPDPGLPHPVAGTAGGERRRWIRHKLHTPVYASFNGPGTGMVVDLSELLDLHEEGFAVQTSEKLEVNRAVTLCLDLPETKSYVHGSGRVIWSDDSGRGGIRFSDLPESSRKVLKEWLFANLLIAGSNYAARTEQRARREKEKFSQPLPVSEAHTVVPVSDPGGTLSSGEPRDEPRYELPESGSDIDPLLQFITERALALTGAAGAALAFLTDEKMICRARAGQPAPPLRALVDVKQGLSGECVRTGLPVSCHDTQNDPRINPDFGRAQGIGSLLAVPILSGSRVLGLVEVFSPDPHGFTDAHATVLGQLISITPNRTQSAALESDLMGLHSIPAAHEDLTEPRSEAREPISPQVAGEVASTAVPEPLPQPPSETAPADVPRLLYRALIGLAIVVVAIVVGYLFGPIIEKRWAPSPQAWQRSSNDKLQAVSTVSGQGLANSTDQRQRLKSTADLQTLAGQGEADAQWQMGVRYHNGEGVPQDDAQAVQWFLRAAEQGHVTAQATLGAYYWAGRGVPQDLSKAYFWSALALADGDVNSKSRLEGLASQMTRAQVFAARQQAEDWIHTHSQRAKSEAN